MGTGFLVAPGLVFTCAHNIYKKEDKKEIKNLRFKMKNK